ncbi:hypothetical protein MPL1032_180161 [Mesorhizobium plurifarium]|uniref:Uncharacterized protein n=1 Tax=Mesorhizobium plurifarium TaxID=69974 RepID=A0A0K2VUH4_MESPL|nr:hypothetical protein MPL1032_180161 [Mesorhizobium plurifarium]
MGRPALFPPEELSVLTGRRRQIPMANIKTDAPMSIGFHRWSKCKDSLARQRRMRR